MAAIAGGGNAWLARRGRCRDRVVTRPSARLPKAQTSGTSRPPVTRRFFRTQRDCFRHPAIPIAMRKVRLPAPASFLSIVSAGRRGLRGGQEAQRFRQLFCTRRRSFRLGCLLRTVCDGSRLRSLIHLLRFVYLYFLAAISDFDSTTGVSTSAASATSVPMFQRAGLRSRCRSKLRSIFRVDGSALLCNRRFRLVSNRLGNRRFRRRSLCCRLDGRCGRWRLYRVRLCR